MKTQLVKLQDYNIIVSDEEIKEGDCFFSTFSNILGKSQLKRWGKDDLAKKVIASDNFEHNLPSINYNGFEKKLGILSPLNYCHQNDGAFIEGFKKAQSLNDKKFTIEDMFQCFVAGMNYEKEGAILQPDAHGYIQSLQQPNTYDIEIEMEEYDSDFIKPGVEEVYIRPKITNNQITITKVL